MNVLVIGGGGREHCLAWKISKSDLVDKIYSIPLFIERKRRI